MNEQYVVATIKSWNIINYYRMLDRRNWHLITDDYDLTMENIKKINPRYIFFPHWSYKIPKEIYDNYECIVFHLTDLPFGRGGSPLQNLISRGIYETKVSAIRVTGEIDAGDIYMKRSLKLNGNAEQILKRCSAITYRMIKYIVHNSPVPSRQVGKPVVFNRRTPNESEIPNLCNMRKVYDYIRMLDGEGYPPSFINTESLRFEFTNAKLIGDHIKADVLIKRRQRE